MYLHSNLNMLKSDMNLISYESDSFSALTALVVCNLRYDGFFIVRSCNSLSFNKILSLRGEKDLGDDGVSIGVFSKTCISSILLDAGRWCVESSLWFDGSLYIPSNTDRYLAR